VSKHGAESAVADRANMGNLGAVLLVDDQAAALVNLEADVVEAETRGVWAAADSDKNDVGIDL